MKNGKPSRRDVDALRSAWKILRKYCDWRYENGEMDEFGYDLAEDASDLLYQFIRTLED